MISSIPIGGNISPEGFLPSILLLVVIIVTVVVVIVILIVVIVGDVSLILKLSFVIIGVPVGLVFLLGLLALAIVAVCASRAVAMPLEIIEEEDGGWNCFLGGNNSSEIKKYQGSNSSDSGNIGDGVKIAGGVIGSGGGIEFSEELKTCFREGIPQEIIR
ncbi:hypothetical protein Tco_0298727 [Tanacetum coccineum]